VYISESFLADKEGKIIELGEGVIVPPEWAIGYDTCEGVLEEIGENSSSVRFNTGTSRLVANNRIMRWEVEDRI
jgi:hypothetical protein